MVAAVMGLAALASSAEAEAQEIQLTGPLAGAPAVRGMRLHRAGRIDVALGATFTLLDEYQRNIIPGLRITYHPTDWFGVGIWGGYSFRSTTSLTDELQAKAIDQRNCPADPTTTAVTACKLTAGNLTRPSLANAGNGVNGTLQNDQLGAIEWMAAPQLTFVPFRGKLALFSAAFIDTDISFFLGPAVIGLLERKPCGEDDDGGTLAPCSATFGLERRVAFAPTVGIGWNFYPTTFLSFGAEYRAMPFAWNTSGFDNAGAGNNEAFPDQAVNAKDRQFRVNSMVTVNLSVQLPIKIKTTE
jgi:hypothetical protein